MKEESFHVNDVALYRRDHLVLVLKTKVASLRISAVPKCFAVFELFGDELNCLFIYDFGHCELPTSTICSRVTS
eukprot:scaffold22596_cov131-Cylindrotheca_fusiformis.AAC.11